MLLGDGPEREQLVERCRAMGLSNVTFLPSQPRDLVPSLLASADIAVIPLKTHLRGAVPSKIYEAMSSGVPIVLAASGEAAKLVFETSSGLIVAPGEVSGLAAALRMLVLDPEKRHSLGANGRKAAKSRFDRTLICSRFLDAIENLPK